jgi:hypothetical protein
MFHAQEPVRSLPGFLWRISLRRMQPVDVYGTLQLQCIKFNLIEWNCMCHFRITTFLLTQPVPFHYYFYYLERSPRSRFIAFSVGFAASGAWKPFATANSVACAFRSASLIPTSASRTSTRTTVPSAARTCFPRVNHLRTCLADTLFTLTVSGNSRDSTTVAPSVKRQL